MPKANSRRLISKVIAEALETRRLLSGSSFEERYGTVDNTVRDLGGVIDSPQHSASEGPEDADYDIQVVFPDSTLTTTQRNAFITAAAKWTSIITADVVDGSYVANGVTVNVDDVRIEATGPAIDGPGNVLGSAGPTRIRSGTLAFGSGKYLPLTGAMQFDSADLTNLEADGTLVDVITHEMGHVLGFGTLWASNYFNLRTGTGTSTVAYTGTGALNQWKALAGDNIVTSVPVANGEYGEGTGSRDAHWRESTFTDELMTYALSGSTRPLSRMTAASMIDLGYNGVNLDGGDFFQIASRNPAPTIASVTSSTTTPGVNTNFTLTANSVADVDGGVANVAFYRESNGIPGLQTQFPSADTLIATDTSAPYSATTQLAATGAATFYARVTDTFGLVSQLRTVVVNAQGGNPPSAISAPDLATASDTGVSSTDNITRDNTPTLTGTTDANTTVTLYRGTTALGSTTSSSTGTWSITPAALADGAYNLTAVASNTFGNVTSSAIMVIIDTVAPSVTSSSFTFLDDQTINANFSEEVPSIDGNDITVRNLTTNTTLPSSSFGAGSSATTAGFTYINGILPNGNYTATFSAGLTDIAGNTLTSTPLSFFFLQGDANHDRSTNFNDLIVLAANYNTTGKNFAQANFNYDSSGAVNFQDLILLAANYNTSLPAPSAGRGVVKLKGNSFSSDWARAQSTGVRAGQLAVTRSTARPAVFGETVIKSIESDTSAQSVLA